MGGKLASKRGKWGRVDFGNGRYVHQSTRMFLLHDPHAMAKHCKF